MARKNYVPKYTIAELQAAATTAFEVSRTVMTAALQAGGKTEYSEAEAKALLRDFTERKVDQ